MKPSLLLLIVLLMYFGWINAIESQEPKNKYIYKAIPEESITIQVKPSIGKVIRCKLQIELDDGIFYDKDYFYDATGITKSIEKDFIKYIGDADNSCSFTVYPNLRKNFFGLQHFGALIRPWRIVGQYKANSRWHCILNYDSDLETCEQLDIVSVNLHDIRPSMEIQTTKIIRKSSSYKNDTITIYAPTEDTMKVHSCSLYSTSTSLFDTVIPYVGGKLIMQYFHRPSSTLQSSQPGYEYIGQEDNSCSFKLKNLDVFDKDFMNQSLYVSVDIASDEKWADYLPRKSLKYVGLEIHYNYYFRMEPLSWWRKNNYSNVFLWPNYSDDDHLFYADPQYF